MQKTKDPIGELLLKTRKDRDVSVPELAKKLDIPKDRIYKWEQGESSPKYEDRMKIEAWIKDGSWINIPLPGKQHDKNENLPQPNTLNEALEIIKQQNAFLQRLVETNLAALSTDVNNNAAAIRAEIRGYAQRQILKEVNYDDSEFLKAKAEADKIYLLSLKQLLGGNKGSAGNQSKV